MNIHISNKRNPYFDLLRGLAILAVIGIHTYSRQMDNTSLVIRQCLNFAVPLFMAISGYMLATKRLDSKAEMIDFWKRQIPKVYVPMIVWSIPYFVMNCSTKGISLYGILMWFVGGYSIYYFIALIVQCYLLLPVLQRIKCKWGGY